MRNLRLMIFRAFFLLLTITSSCIGQAKDDYRIYSKVIDTFINVGIKYKILTSQAVVIDKFKPTENWASYFLDILLDTSRNSVYSYLNFDKNKIILYEDSDFHKAVKVLSKEFYNTPILNESSFLLRVNVKAITNSEFTSLFKKGKSIKRITNGWGEFYRRYPGSHGVFEFSKIIYHGDYALLYCGRHSGGLSATGDIIVLHRDVDGWGIITYFNLWVS